MTNLGMRKALGELGLTFIEADVGDRHVMDELINNNAILGGEGSGHLICLDKHTTGDGIVAALQVLSAMKQSQQSLAELLEKVTLFPQTLTNVRYQQDYDWKSDAKLKEAVEHAEKELKGTGRVLIRASGTEPLLRVMVEAQNSQQSKDLAQKIAAVIPV